MKFTCDRDTIVGGKKYTRKSGYCGFLGNNSRNVSRRFDNSISVTGKFHNENLLY